MNGARLVNGTTGALAARWDFDAFGNQITDWVSESESSAELRPIRFSTKYLDVESGWSYYGYRYYAAADGRWVSRDPIEEDGGANLYGFVANSPLDNSDFLGLIDQITYLPTRVPKPATPSWLPNVTSIAGAKGWNHLAAFFSKWFGKQARTISDGTKMAPGDPYDDTTLSYDWVMGFQRSRDAYKKLVRKSNWLDSEDTKILMRKRIGPLLQTNTNSIIGEKWLNGSTSWSDLNKVWIKQEAVTSGFSSNPDALDAALHNFNLMAVVKGCGMKQGGQYYMSIDEIGVYVRDTFNFTDEQRLGYWGMPNRVLPPYIGGFAAKSTDFEVTNASFRDFRKTTGMGQDFFIFTKIERVKLGTPWRIKF